MFNDFFRLVSDFYFDPFYLLVKSLPSWTEDFVRRLHSYFKDCYGYLVIKGK